MTGPEHYRQAEQLLHELRDGHAEGTDVPGILAAAQVHATLALAAPDDQPLTVYRASHDSIAMGLYTTRQAARAHCEAEEAAASTTDRAPFDWIEDEEDGVDEMTAWTGGEECTTGYIVTALTVAAEYDPEADA
jgi:hypothetical protein